jgi:ferredoxin
MGVIREVHVDSDKCTCHELCVSFCPEVFEVNVQNATARVKDGALRHFGTHSAQIMEAIRNCPTYAIWAEVDRD